MLTAAPTETTAPDYTLIARTAAMRAESIRHSLARRQCADPLRAAWERRAGELELASAALWPEAAVSPALQRTA